MKVIPSPALARQLAMAIALAGRAECRGRPEWWSAHEAAHAAASSRRQAADAAAPALALCARCPVVGDCGLRAVLDGYTGLAAGVAYVNGNRVLVDQLRNSRRAPDRIAG